MGQQACRRNALVDDLRRHRRLHQRFALPADPFAADVAFHRKDAGLVVELLRYVLADALQLAVASARGGIRIVAYFLAWQRGRQWCAECMKPLIAKVHVIAAVSSVIGPQGDRQVLQYTVLRLPRPKAKTPGAFWQPGVF